MEHKRPLSIFILEDDMFCGSIYEQHMRNLGYRTVRLFTDVDTCLTHLSEGPDVLFLDDHLELVKGRGVLQTIGRINPNIYLVIISGEETTEITANLLKYGVFGYITKGADELMAIEAVLKKIDQTMTLLEMRPPITRPD